jgi:catalase
VDARAPLPGPRHPQARRALPRRAALARPAAVKLRAVASELAERLVDAINDVSGRHAGHRAAHAKGALCAGTFTAAAEAAALTRAAHMQGEPVRVTVRFSNGSGDPGAADTERLDGRGIAVKFYLPDGATTDIVALTIPVFFVRTPEDFLAFMRARRPDPATGQPDGSALGAFVAEHPETAAALQLVVPTLVPPRSYATCVYNSLHAFRLVDSARDGRWVRYRLAPEAGAQTMSDELLADADRDYLQAEIRERLARESVRFRLLARLAGDGDALDDPTLPWPEERDTVDLGRLELTGLETERERGDDVLVFDPTRVTDGIELSHDPILRIRSDAYAVSVERRSGVARQAGVTPA